MYDNICIFLNVVISSIVIEGSPAILLLIPDSHKILNINFDMEKLSLYTAQKGAAKLFYGDQGYI